MKADENEEVKNDRCTKRTRLYNGIIAVRKYKML